MGRPVPGPPAELAETRLPAARQSASTGHQSQRRGPTPAPVDTAHPEAELIEQLHQQLIPPAAPPPISWWPPAPACSARPGSTPCAAATRAPGDLPCSRWPPISIAPRCSWARRSARHCSANCASGCDTTMFEFAWPLSFLLLLLPWLYRRLLP